LQFNAIVYEFIDYINIIFRVHFLMKNLVGSYGNTQSSPFQMIQESGEINMVISMFQKVKEAINFLFVDKVNRKKKKLRIKRKRMFE